MRLSPVLLILSLSLLLHFSLKLEGQFSKTPSRQIASIETEQTCIDLLFEITKGYKRPWVSRFSSWTNNKATKFAKAVDTYLYEVKETAGLRLILKDIKVYQPKPKYLVLYPYTKPADMKWYSRPFSRTIQFIPKRITKWIFKTPHEFHPIDGLLNPLIGKPTSFASKKIFGVEKEWTLLVTMPVSFGIFWVIYEYFDEEYNKALEKKLEDQIEEKGAEYDRLINSQYYLTGIKELLDSKKVTPKKAHQMAAIQINYLNSYFKEMNESYAGMSESERVSWSLENPLFIDIKRLVVEGIPKKDAYIFHEDFQQKLSPEQVVALVEVMHELYATYNGIETLINNSTGFNIAENPFMQSLQSYLEQDQFAIYLNRKVSKGLLTKDQLIFRLQEDAYWQTLFKTWEIMRVSKRKKDDNDHYTNTPLTLDDIRKETAHELNQKKAP